MPNWYIKNLTKYKRKSKNWQKTIFIEVQAYLLPLLTGAPLWWNFEPFSFIRLADYTNDSQIIQSTSSPYNSRCPNVRVAPQPYLGSPPSD